MIRHVRTALAMVTMAVRYQTRQFFSLVLTPSRMPNFSRRSALPPFNILNVKVYKPEKGHSAERQRPFNINKPLHSQHATHPHHLRLHRVTAAMAALEELDANRPLAKYEYLISLLHQDFDLFYACAVAHTATIMPLIYTPLVGAACTSWSHLSAPYRGLYVTLEDSGRVEAVLRSWPQPCVRAICVTDGGRILGLGDLGANGMGIPVGKLALYSALAGVDPTTTLPVTIDAGTDNEFNLVDTAYVGLRRRRETGPAYYALVEEFVCAVKTVFGADTLVQWEDFENSAAFVLLDKYKDVVPSFNDDIQGTGAVVLAGLLSASAHVDGVPAIDQAVFLFVGAGEAGLGIADLIAYGIVQRSGMSMEQARARIWLVDSKGLVTAERAAAESRMARHKLRYAHAAPPSEERCADTDLASIVRRVRPTALIGVSAHPSVFTKDVIGEMAAINERPVIFALSNPTSKSECTAEEAYRWTDGAAVFASGSPFDPVTLTLSSGVTKTFTPGQGNNAYIFPALALATIAVRMSRVCTSSLYAAAVALSHQVDKVEANATGNIYPPLSRIRPVSAAVAVAVAEDAYATGVAREPRPADIAAHVRQSMWNP